MAKWTFYAIDNGGKRQALTISAKDKTEAIKKGFERAKKHATGDLINWRCNLKSA